MRSAVDVDLFACNIGSFSGSQEQDRIGNFLGLAGTSHGDAVDDFVRVRLRKGFPDLGVNQARAYAVDGDAFCGDFPGQVLENASTAALEAE